MSRRVHGRGTAERVWTAWPCAFPAIDLNWRRVLVVSPHPDDETLGVGGTVRLLFEAGSEVEVLAVTDGERGTPTGRRDAALARRRRDEVARALTILLDNRPAVHRLGIPDGGIGAEKRRVAEAIRERLRPDSWCLVTHRNDGHPDHEAAYAAAAVACRAAGRPLLEYPVWLWHWASPMDLSHERARFRRVELPAAVRQRKQAAVEAFRSQTAGGDAAILPPHVLARFLRPFEVVAT